MSKDIYICKNCSNQFQPKDKRYSTFCSQSCSATYNNTKRTYIKTGKKWYCKNCGLEHRKSNNGKNKYCNNICQHEFYWKEKIKEIENGNIYKPERLKKFLKEKHGNQCSECNLPNEWNGQPLVLQLDHIDGNSDNNLPNNLRLLCPNCHSQTETYTGKGGIKYKNTKRNRYLRRRLK